jgi:ligand-binding SRPBCC domain-containing protein
VLARFDTTLFRALAPPFPRLHIDRFDGSSPGNVVAVRLDWGLFQQTWTSLITGAGATDTAAWFVDEGQTLPWPLRRWQHRHIVERDAPSGRTAITDAITYSTGFAPLDWLLLPVMWAQFAYRKPIYRRLLSSGF